MKMEQTVFIVGLGLIGSSLAVCIKNEHPDITLLGYDAHQETMAIAKQQRIIDDFTEDFEQACLKADIIILAGPVHTTLAYLKQLASYALKPNVLVTDVGSTKSEIVRYAEQFTFDFIGGHPMAGSHKSGVLAVDKRLFENAYFLFTPARQNDARVNELQQLYQGTKAKFIELSPTEHDSITGMVSHLPHIIASSLVNQVDSFSAEHPRVRQLAAGGFRDVTRIASSDPTMWTDILLSNQTLLVKLIDAWQQNMDQVKYWIQNSQKEAIYTFFENAKETRDTLPIHQRGAIPGFYDLFVNVPDHPGVIAEVTSLIAEAKLSLVNVKILETREDIIGILQLSFKNEEDLLAAKNEIEAKTSYHCHMK